MIFGLERDDFVSEKTWETESERIFSKNWVCAGRVETLLSKESTSCFRTVQIGNYDIILLRDDQGKLKAFHNTCRHRGTRLVDDEFGPLKNCSVTCPYHSWTYNADGTLIGAPNMREVNDFDASQFGLKPVPCFDWCGFVMLNPGKAEAQFTHDFAAIIRRMQSWNMDSLQCKQTLRYEVNANWKLIFQNYSECYHCPTVHPDLNRLTPYRESSNDLEEGPFLGGPMQLSEGIETISTDGKHIGVPLPGLDDQQRRLVYYYTLFPTMFLSPHPDYVMAHEIHPRQRDKTEILCHFLSSPSTTNASIERAVEQWDEVNQQDWKVCEWTQRGIESPAYTPGPYSNLEPMLIAFDEYYRSIMLD